MNETIAVTDDLIDGCGFRMFDLHEIAATMVMHTHPAGGDYEVLGNKRERMAQYGNAVTPPATLLKLTRLAEVLGGGFTFSDLFCGAGGSSIGATLAGGELVLGLNHWRRAIETHSTNFPGADHDCADVSALTTARIRSYPDSDVLLASPECTSHSIAKGGRRRKPKAASLFDDGPAGDDEQDRSRATMWDVCRFAEAKIDRGRPYKAIVVENVIDAYKWGADDDGGLFTAWLMAMRNMGYEHEIVWLNSMFAWPTPQSRDRMYVVFWRKGITAPNLRIEPVSWCPHCEKVVEGRQVWKRPDRPLVTAQGKPTGARYGKQYLFACPDCRGIVLPGVFPAASAIDFTLPTSLIGDRERDVAENTRERIRRGLERILGEPFAIRLTHDGVPKPLTLPLVTLTKRHDMAMVLPIAGNTFERTPGNRARDANTRPMDTVHCGAQVGEERVTTFGLVMANTENGVPRPADREAAQTLRTEGGLAMVVPLQRNGKPSDAAASAAGTIRAGGFHHALVMRNNDTGKRSSSGWQLTPDHEPTRTFTANCEQSLVFPYQSEPHGTHEAVRTLTSRDTIALVVPPTTTGMPRDAHTDPSFVQTTETRPSLLVAKGQS